MLRELSVQNLALIEDVRVELSPGFCAWTGETGAGKSLLLGALGLLLGERGNTDLIRTGMDEIKIIGRFELVRPELKTAIEAILHETLEDDSIILTRRLTRTGRNTTLVNENPVALSTLRKIGEVLVDIHGQRESHSLLLPSYQLQLLDAFGELDDQRNKYAEIAERVRDLRRRHRELSEKQQQRQRELSLIRFEREELDHANLQPGEKAELDKERQRLTHAQSLQSFTAMGAAELYDDEGAISDRLGKLLKDAERWAELDPDLNDISTRLQSLISEVQDIAEVCRDLSERFESDPDRLEEIEKRIVMLRKLELKYRKTTDELITYRETLDQQETAHQKDEDDLTGIEEELGTVFAELKSAATVLTKARKKIAKKLAKETQAHLADLGMPNALLETGLEETPIGDDPLESDVPSFGADRMELMLAANPGEPARPLRKVASGGELSRTMLALKTVLAEHDAVGTLIFDEIDSNVGGRLGDVLGEKLAALGRTHQVVCVTHLPQVASYARNQWTIRKHTKAKRTSTVISPLGDETDRIEELASMLRGESKGETTRQEAMEMLQAARKKW